MTKPQMPSANPNCLLCGKAIGGGCTCSQYTDVTRTGTLDRATGTWTVRLWPEIAPTIK